MIPSRRERTLAFIAFMEAEIPGCRIRFKDDPPETMPLLDRLMHWGGRLVTPDYHRRFTTVIYPNIYLPAGTREIYEQAPEQYYETFRHEFVHLKDWQRFHLWMAVSYAVLLPVGWTMRGFWELRGYAQNLICRYERYGQIPDSEIERLTDIFAGRDYVFMMVPRKRARRALLEMREAILDGRLSGVYPYGRLKNPPPE